MITEKDINDYANLAEKAFSAYNEEAGGKTWDGKEIPPFSEVGEKVRNNWIAAAKKVVDETFPKEDGIIHVVTEEDTELIEAGAEVGEVVFSPDSAILSPGDEGYDEALEAAGLAGIPVVKE